MKQSAKDQHEVDKANLAAAKAEAKAQWEEAKRTPKQQQEAMRQKQAEQIADAKAREAEANERIAAAKEWLRVCYKEIAFEGDFFVGMSLMSEVMRLRRVMSALPRLRVPR